MPADDSIPIVIGVGDIINRSQRVEDAVEPMQLMRRAIVSAVSDTLLPLHRARELQASIDSLEVVASWTWPYHDLPGLLSQELHIQPKRKNCSKHGGHQPMKLVDEAARRISLGTSSVAIVVGGESLASLGACRAAKISHPPSWSTLNHLSGSLPHLDLSQFGGIQEIGAVHSLSSPSQIYPLYENGFRAHRGLSLEQSHAESAKLYAEFAKIAEQNPFSWSHGQPAATEEQISTICNRNRMICFPYPLLMNAFNNVNLAAACLLTSTKHARELGIPASRWIYLLGGAGTQDADCVWDRPNFYSSPAISLSLDACLQVAGLRKEQIDLFDLYSCFPIVPKLACHDLEMPLTAQSKPITLLGGLTSFGGAGNNYSMHALTAMVRRMRAERISNGLILANGGVLTYQHAMCLSTQPRRDGCGYPKASPLPEYVRDLPIPSVIAEAEGKSVIETYTVEFDREGAPAKGFVIGRLIGDRDGRFIANAGNAKTLEQLATRTKEPIGSFGWVKTDANGRNLFYLDRGASL